MLWVRTKIIMAYRITPTRMLLPDSLCILQSKYILPHVHRPYKNSLRTAFINDPATPPVSAIITQTQPCPPTLPISRRLRLTWNYPKMIFTIIHRNSMATHGAPLSNRRTPCCSAIHCSTRPYRQRSTRTTSITTSNWHATRDRPWRGPCTRLTDCSWHHKWSKKAAASIRNNRQMCCSVVDTADIFDRRLW